MLNKPTITDEAILERIRNSNLQGWEELYERYAPAMMGIIYKLTDDKRKAEKILINIFTGRGFEGLLKSMRSSLRDCVYSYTFCKTINLLKAEGIQIDAGVIAGLPGLYRTVYRKKPGDKFIARSNTEKRAKGKPGIWMPVLYDNALKNPINYS